MHYFTGWLTLHSLLLVQWAIFIVLCLVFRLPKVTTAKATPGSTGTAPASREDTEHLAHKNSQDEQHHQKHEQTGMPCDEIVPRIASGFIRRGGFVQGIAAQHHQHRRHTVTDALTEVAGLE
ncbi:hypothetical protein BSF44_44710 [Pseudomonas sp. ACN8]|nr:hypothetical protein BSF44_44710 [Pseudomonas sp. ACN8]